MFQVVSLAGCLGLICFRLFDWLAVLFQVIWLVDSFIQVIWLVGGFISGYLIGWRFYSKWLPHVPKSRISFEIWRCNGNDLCSSQKKHTTMLALGKSTAEAVSTIFKSLINFIKVCFFFPPWSNVAHCFKRELSCNAKKMFMVRRQTWKKIERLQKTNDNPRHWKI